MELTAAVRSDRGLVRETNQDTYLVLRSPHNNQLLVAVADGMGGAQGGEVASQMAIDALIRRATGVWQLTAPQQRMAWLLESVAAANQEIYSRASIDERLRGMGTTLTAAFCATESILVAHVGDSRAYLFQEGSVKQLTTDHSLVQQLIDGQQLSEEEAAVHPQRNVLTRAVGVEPSVEIDCAQHAWSPGDILLLCTDGLTHVLQPPALQEALQLGSVEHICRALIEKTLQAGAPDNVTVLAVQNGDRSSS